MSRVWGGTAFAKRSGAMKAPVGLLSGRAVCDSRWRGVAPTSATPTRSLRKCRRIVEVKSRMDRKFQELKICGHGTVLAPYLCAQNQLSTNVSELLRRKISREFHCSCMLIAVCSERSSCPCFAAALAEKPVSRSDGL